MPKTLLLHLKCPKEKNEGSNEAPQENQSTSSHESFVPTVETVFDENTKAPTLEEVEQKRALEEETYHFDADSNFLDWDKVKYDKNMLISEIRRLEDELKKMNATVPDCTKNLKKQGNKEFPSLREQVYDTEQSIVNDGSLCCWWCTEPFQGIVYRYPISFSKTRQKYLVTGCFCGFPCVFAYGWKNHPCPCFHSSLILSYLKQKFPDETIGNGRAHDYTEHIKFGGTKITEQVRQCEELSVRNRGIDFMPKDETKLRYKRSKPLPNEIDNPLLKFMGKK